MVSLAKHWVCIQSYSTGFLIRSWLYINSKEILAEICRVHINKIFWCKYPKKYQSDEWSIFWKLVCPFRPMCAAGKHSFIGLHLWDTQTKKTSRRCFWGWLRLHATKIQQENAINAFRHVFEGVYATYLLVL